MIIIYEVLVRYIWAYKIVIYSYCIKNLYNKLNKIQ